jgi:hypothetical protein
MRKPVPETATNTVELSDLYSRALTNYLHAENERDAKRPYPPEPLTASFIIECALRQFWHSNRHNITDLAAYNTVTEVRRG